MGKDYRVINDREIAIHGLLFKMTCSACPEQYDVFDGRGRQAGYVRLRHGHMTVYYPNVGGRLVYEAEPNGDGLFSDEDEREFHLTKAAEAIREATHD